MSSKVNNDIVTVVSRNNLQSSWKDKLIPFIPSKVSAVSPWLFNHINNYDIIYLHLPKHSLASVTALFGSIFGKTMIAKISNSGPKFDFAELSKRKLGSLRVNLYRHQLDRIIAISSDIEGELINYGFKKSKIERIPNGVKLERNEPVGKEEKRKVRKDLGINKNKRYFLYVGSFEPRKNVRVLIKSFSQLSEHFRDVELIMLGDGSLYKEVKGFIEKRGISDKVILPGTVEDVSKYYKASDFFVLPSKTEGLSNALLESMSFGLVPIATEVSGNVDLINHQDNGILVEPNCVEALVSAMKSILTKNEIELESMSESSINTIRYEFSMDAVTVMYDELFSELL